MCTEIFLICSKERMFCYVLTYCIIQYVKCPLFRPLPQQIRSNIKYTGNGFVNGQDGFISNDYPAPDD